tara:strand:- start:218 stop:478 length:261 start_codon:yes stop_codon:yes gene_type:complete
MKTIILTSVLLMSMTTNAQTVAPKNPIKMGHTVTNKERRAARKRLPSYSKNHKKNVRTHVVCSTIFATCLGVWFNVDNISEAVKKN